jgi:hypothetical protein
MESMIPTDAIPTTRDQEKKNLKDGLLEINECLASG